MTMERDLDLEILDLMTMDAMVDELWDIIITMEKGALWRRIVRSLDPIFNKD